MKKTLACLGITLGAFALSALDVNAVEIKTEEIANSTYVIGTHMFTREGSEYYDGILTTDYIMLASQTINSNKLDDMTIYYKNPRGKWIDVLKNENVEMAEELEITHKDNALYMETPTLRNDTLENWKDQFDGEYKALLYEGAYGYDLAIDKSVYRIGDDYNNYNVKGYEIYEKTSNGYKLVEGYPMTGSEVVFVQVKPGKKKEYASRVYATDSNGIKYYSDYSNTITIDHTQIETPVLRNDTVENFKDQFDGEYKATLYEGAYGYDLAINKALYRVSDNYNDYNVTGYEIYEKTSTGYKLIESHLMTGVDALMVEVEPGEKKEYVSRVYATDYDGVKHYSDYSNVITIDHTAIEKPTLDVPAGSEDTALYLDFSIATEGYYNTERALSTISGWELYEKTGNKYTMVGTSERYSIDVTIYAGETKTYVARTYALNKSGEKIYSEYSNEITQSKTVKAPTLDVPAGSEDTALYLDFSIATEGHYVTEAALSTIDGWELYEKTNDKYTLVGTSERYSIDVTLYAGEIKTYVARAYALNKDGEKIYSEYSNEITQSKTVKAPTLTAGHGSIGFVGFTIYLEGHYMDEFSSQTIDGWELYEKVGNNYNLLDGYEVELNEDETRTFVARAYALNEKNQKIYSDYSNEVTQ